MSEQLDLMELVQRAQQGEKDSLDRLAEIAAELDATGASHVTAETVTTVLRGFDGAWEGLNVKERARLLALLTERITYDGEAGTMAITFRPNGLDTISDEQTSHH